MLTGVRPLIFCCRYRDMPGRVGDLMIEAQI